jgi:hypothetical protein
MTQHDSGVVLIATLIAGMLVIALATSLVAVTTAETLLSANYRNASEGLYAAEGAIELVLDELSSSADWSAVLAAAPDATCSGASGGWRPAGFEPTGIWAADNPVWRCQRCGRLAELLPGVAVESAFAVGAWVADDPADGDGDPRTDSNGVLTVRGEAFGPMGAHRAVEATAARRAPGIAVVSWRILE